jgi:hypothetical protein
VPDRNPAFPQFENDYWLLYKLCRYNALICRDRVSRAVRTDNRANNWLVASTCGAGMAGTIQVLTVVNTTIVWEIASLVSVGLALQSLLRKATEVKYNAFSSTLVFENLATEVSSSARIGRMTGTSQDIESTYMRLYNLFSDQISKLGPDHTHYEAAHKIRLEQQLEDDLKREGRTPP